MSKYRRRAATSFEMQGYSVAAPRAEWGDKRAIRALNYRGSSACTTSPHPLLPWHPEHECGHVAIQQDEKAGTARISVV